VNTSTLLSFRYENIMKFVIMKIYESEPTVSKYSNALVDIMKKILPDHLYCLGIISATGCYPDYVKILATSMREEDVWFITDLGQFRSLTELLKQRMPNVINMDIANELTDEDEHNLYLLLSTIRQTFSGTLRITLNHSYNLYKPIDERIVAELKNTK